MRQAPLSQDAPDLTEDVVTKAYQDFPVKEKDQLIRELKDALVECTILLTVGASEPATDRAIRIKMSNRINENMKLI